MRSSDYYFLAPLLGSAVITLMFWDRYNCRYPFNAWLLVSYMALMANHGLHLALLKLHAARRQRPCLKLGIQIIDYGVMYPFLVAWTMLTGQSEWWAGLLWITFLYLFIVVYGVVVALTVRTAHRYRQLIASLGPEVTARRGLNPAAINALPLRHVAEGDKLVAGITCSICLSDVSAGDTVRQLPCTHVFHQPCIDKWLRIRGVCPNCKAHVPAACDLQEALLLAPQAAGGAVVEYGAADSQHTPGGSPV